MSKIEVYDRDRYLENMDQVNNACLYIIRSRETNKENHQKQKDTIEELTGNLFIDDLNAQIFILKGQDGYGKTLPASFAIFTSTDKPNTWVMEMIYSHKNRSNAKNADTLFKYALKYLKENKGVEEVVATVANNNEKSLNFHNKMMNTFAEGKSVKSDGEEDFDDDEIDIYDGENMDDLLNNPNFDKDLLATNSGVTKFYFDLTKEFKTNMVEASLSNSSINASNSATKENNEEIIKD